jgi:hypothetical protein
MRIETRILQDSRFRLEGFPLCIPVPWIMQPRCTVLYIPHKSSVRETYSWP